MPFALRFCLLIAIALPLRIAYSAAGDADPTFGNGAGFVTYAAPYDAPWIVTGGIALEDGSSILAGHADGPVYVRHYYRDGTLDSGFGTAGTAALSDFPFPLNTSNQFFPSLRAYPGPNGTVLLEQDGVIRRLSATGQYDSTYRPRTLNPGGASVLPRPKLLPQSDGGFIVVTAQQAATNTLQISVRYYLADGSPDTVRGDVNGNRLVYPGGTGSYNPTGAAMQADGKLLLAAVFHRSTVVIDLVLIRLNADGSYDTGFGQNGLVTVSAEAVLALPSVTVGSNGQIAYMFGIGNTPPKSFVVYILRADGAIDTSAPSGGRISVFLDDPSVGTANPAFASPPPHLAVHMKSMLWQVDLTQGGGAVPPPRYSKASLNADFAETGFAFGGDTLWVFGADDFLVYGFQGSTQLATYQRGVAVPYDAPSFGMASPPSISASFPASPYLERFDDLQLQPDGGMLVLGRLTKFGTISTLTKFRTDGTVDTAFASGTGRIMLPRSSSTDTTRLLRATDGSATMLVSIFSGCSVRGCETRTASLMRFMPSGAADSAFGDAGTVTVATISLVNDFGAGFVDDGGTTTIPILSNSFGGPTVQLQPLRFGPDGAPPAGFNGRVQSAMVDDVAQPRSARLDHLPDGRLQAIVASGGNQQISLTTFRWLANGAVDPTLTAPLTTVLPTVNLPSYAHDLHALVLPDGSTIVAVWEASQRILLRLDAGGKQDMSFGNAGTARIDGVVLFPGREKPRLRLAVQPDGKILLAYSIQTTGGTAVAVARFLADGQPDTTFTADGRFDSVFAVTGAETASDIVRRPDGRLMVAGVSNERGLLLRLKGEATPLTPSQNVIEFFNTSLGHYFITANPIEAAGIDQGGAGPGWQRTGNGFLAWTLAGGLPGGSLPVCRFYGTPGRGPNSHFYTANAIECALVRNDPGWTYEGIAFYVVSPGSMPCAGNLQPVNRAYNNRYAQNDSNHRYASDLSLLQPLVTQGWTIEGAVFCVPMD